MIPARWRVAAVFYLSSTLNYLDRMVLAALAPLLVSNYHLSNEAYGQIIAVFSVTYAIASPVAGWFLDRVGLNRGISLAVAFWSLAAMARGFVSTLGGFQFTSALLGIGEAAGIPATGKLAARYLEPRERALGAAVSQIGLSLGAIIAPPLATWLALGPGWSWAFVIPGALGFFWIPLWWWMKDRAPLQAEAAAAGKPDYAPLFRDPLIYALILGNILSMSVYSLWTNWTTVYLTRTFSLSLTAANALAPLPNFASYGGSLLGGWLSYRAITRGAESIAARRRVCLWAAAGVLLSTALVPLTTTPALAIAGISLSFFFASGWGVNFYTIPLDAYGAARAGFATSLLTMGYGVLQIIVSPLIGRSVDHLGFAPVCLALAATPLAAWLLLTAALRRR